MGSLCRICEKNFTADRDPFTHHCHAHSAWDSLCQSLEQECPICWILWRNIRASPFATPRAESRPFVQSFASCWDWTSTDAIPDGLKFSTSAIESSSSFVGLLPLTSRNTRFNPFSAILFKADPSIEKNDEPIRTLEYVSDLSHDQISDNSVNQIKHWIGNCLHSHEGCSRRQTSASPSITKVPTRLLRLYTPPTPTRGWSLVETNESSQDFAQYAAVSHRWFEKMPRLLRGELDGLKQGKPDEYLPRHFQDILNLCRRLSIQYIWIDSLCIFQDSLQDLQKEAAAMATVYMNAQFTFSICWASESQGCLPQRKPHVLQPVQVDVRWASIVADQRAELVRTIAYERQDQLHAIENADINTRGWVFQERILSPRILFLGDEQMYWECDCLRASELFPTALPDLEISGVDPRIFFQLSSKTDLDNMWPKLLRAYSKTRLTYEKDRLLALSGLVRLLASRLGKAGRYLAGIWERRWIDGLLWKVVPRFNMKNEIILKGSGAICPSWSWVSSAYESTNIVQPKDDDLLHELERTNPSAISSPGIDLVEFSDYKDSPDQSLTRLSHSKIEPTSGGDEFGSVSFASIDLTGLLIPVWLPPLWRLRSCKDSFEIDKDTTMTFKKRHGNMKLIAMGQPGVHFALVDFWVSTHDMHINKNLEFLSADYERESDAELPSDLHEKAHRYQSDRVHVNLTSQYDPERPCFLLPLIDAQEVIDNDGLDYMKGLVLQHKSRHIDTHGAYSSDPIEPEYIRIGSFYDYPRLGTLGKLIINTTLCSWRPSSSTATLRDRDDDMLQLKVIQYLKQKYGTDVKESWSSYSRSAVEFMSPQHEIPVPSAHASPVRREKRTHQDYAEDLMRASKVARQAHMKAVDGTPTAVDSEARDHEENADFLERTARIFMKRHVKVVNQQNELDAEKKGRYSRWNRCSKPSPHWNSRLVADWIRVKLV